MRGSHSSGQAAVELVVLLPLVAGLALALLQVALAAHAGWAAEQAARAAARASAVAGDPVSAARAALPAHLARRARVRSAGAGVVTVRVRVPSLLPALDVGTLTARATFAPQR